MENQNWLIAQTEPGQALLAEPPDKQRVPLRAVKSNAVDGRLAFGRIDHLPNAQQRRTTVQPKQLGDIHIGRGRVNFFVGISQLHAV